jgi:transcriptional regulator with XRE-family HTH domain
LPEVRSPAVRRRELGALLRALRNEKGLTVEQVAERLLCSTSKVSRMETGHGIATPRDVRDLCDLYGVTDPAERDRMMTLAREGKQRAWWQSYDLAYANYVGLEEEAVAISAFQSSVVHGLLHTADYARANHESSMPRLDPERIDRQIEAKLTRQRILTQADPPSFAVVLDEAALHRMVGGHKVMAAQLAKVLDISALPNVTVQVLPYEVGAHPALESNFTILQLPDPTPGVVFVEGLIGSTYLERAEDLERYHSIFGELQSIALDPKDTADMIAKLHQIYNNGLDSSLRNSIKLYPLPSGSYRQGGGGCR